MSNKFISSQVKKSVLLGVIALSCKLFVATLFSPNASLVIVPSSIFAWIMLVNCSSVTTAVGISTVAIWVPSFISLRVWLSILIVILDKSTSLPPISIPSPISVPSCFLIYTFPSVPFARDKFAISLNCESICAFE